MAGSVRCVCCNKPVPVSDEDIGLTVNCPRTGRMVAVRASDVLPAKPTQPPTPATPVAKAKPSPSQAAPVSRPPTPAPPKRQVTTGSRPLPVAKPPAFQRWLAVAGLTAFGLMALAGIGLYAVFADRPEAGVWADRGAEPVKPGTGPTPPTPGSTTPAPATPGPATPGPAATRPSTPAPSAPTPPSAPGAPTPAAPARTVPASLGQMTATYQLEVVRVNHPKNCVLCHAPSFQQTDLVRGAVPDPRQPLPPPTTPAYYERGGQFVAADTTYLRQDFSVVQPVIDSGNWPTHQRFDYFVALRQVNRPPATAPAPDSPYRRAIGFALRELSGRDPQSHPDWVAEQRRAAVTPPDTRLGDVARLATLQADPKALVALAALEYTRPLLATPGDELEVVVKELQAAHGDRAARTALVAYLEPLTRASDPARRGKASRLLLVVMSGATDASLPARMSAAATVPAAARPLPAIPPPVRSAAPAAARTDDHGLRVYAVAKRLDTRGRDDLEKELLGVREVGLDAGAEQTATAKLIGLASTRKRSGQPYPGSAVACEDRADLAGLPFRVGTDATLTKDKADALHALSKALRETVQGCMIRPDDPRPDTNALYAALLGEGTAGFGRGFRRHDPQKWATAEAVPCVQQILAAENRDVRRLACELLNRIDTADATEALIRMAVFETDPAVRAAAVEALRPRPGADVTTQLLRYVRYPWPRAAEHAAEAIVALGCKEAIPRLAAMYDLPDPDAPFRVLTASVATPAAPAAPGAPAAPAMPEVAPPGSPTAPATALSAVAVEAAVAVAARAQAAAEQASLDEYVAASTADDAAARRTAAEGLATFLTHANATLRRRAATALAAMGADAEPAIDALRTAAEDPDADVQAAARRAVAKLEAVATAARRAKAREVLAPVVKELTAKEPEDRVKALLKIGEYGPDAGVFGEQVIEAMRDKVAAVQAAAADALKKISPKVHPHVVAVHSGPNKREALTALGELGGDADIAVAFLLFCHDNPRFWESRTYDDLFPVVAKIAPKDPRFAAAVLRHLTVPNTKSDRILRERRLAALAQLDVIEAKPADKVAALVAALADGEAAVQLIGALEGFGADAKPALPALKKLKTSSVEAVRTAAITAIAKIESAAP